MAESKDARRTRLKNEGKALIAAGRHSEITPQHQSAMDYFARKNASKGAKVKEANAAKQTEGASTGLLQATSQAYIPEAAKGDVHAKIGKTLASYGSKLGTVTRRLRTSTPLAINEDTTHHAALGTIGDHLSEKLEQAHDNGQLHARDAINIDQALRLGHTHLEHSNNAHDRGYIEDAKVHMHHAANSYYSAATQMEAKGIVLHKSGANVGGMAKDIASQYSTSTLPGYGAMPHEGYDKKLRPARRHSVAGSSTSERELAQKDAAEIAAPKKQTRRAISDLSKSFESDHPDLDTSGYDREPSATTHSVMGSQLRDYFGGN